MNTKAPIPMILGLVLAACGGPQPKPAILVDEGKIDAGPRGEHPAEPPPARDPTAVEPPKAPRDAGPADASTEADAAPGKPSEVHGTATLTIERHCGGAAPPRHEDPPRPGPAANRKLYATSGGNKVATVTTDARGAFTLTLPPGEYCLVDSARADDNTPASKTVDETCLAKWKKDCDVTFRVPRAEPLELALVKPCEHPCYDGPRPK